MKELTKNKKQKQYVTVKPGIRLDVSSGKYQASKRVDGVRCSLTFNTIPEADLWLKTYVPEFLKNPITKSFESNDDAQITFHEAWEQYKTQFLIDTASSTYRSRLMKEKIFKGLFNFRMREITSKVITNFIRSEKSKCLEGTKKMRRCNFDDDLKALKAFFNWWREESEDIHFANPVLAKHKKQGKIKDTPYREKKMNKEELRMFFDALGYQALWQDLALFQFYIAGRIQEPTAIQSDRIDLNKREVLIKEVAVWGIDKNMAEIKSLPKNEQPEPVYLNDTLLEIATRRIQQAKQVTVNGEKYKLIFHINSVPVSYRQVQYHYNKALKSCGLDKKYSGTHLMRHSMGTLTRSVTGNLDSAQAVTRHKDSKVAQQYSNLDFELQKQAANAVEKFMGYSSAYSSDAHCAGHSRNRASLKLLTSSDE